MRSRGPTYRFIQPLHLTNFEEGATCIAPITPNMRCYYVDRSDLEGQRLGSVVVTKQGNTATVCRDQRFDPSLIQYGRGALVRLHEGADTCSCHTGETVVRIQPS